MNSPRNIQDTETTEGSLVNRQAEEVVAFGRPVVMSRERQNLGAYNADPFFPNDSARRRARSRNA